MARHQWAHAAAAGVPSRALAWWLEKAALEELEDGLQRGGEDDLSPLFSRRVLLAPDQLLPPVSRLQFEQQSSHFRQARNSEDARRVSSPIVFLFARCSLSCGSLCRLSAVVVCAGA